jgi:PAS domain S-box-containing protein
MRDISERKKNEKKLQESEALYQSIINASPDDITITDLEGKVLYISPKALTMFGYENGNQIIGRSIVEFVAPEDLEKAKHGAKSMLEGNHIGTTEYKAIRADGSIFDVESKGEFIRDNDGNAVKIVYIVRDISDRKKAENALKESELQYRALADSGQALIWTATPDKKCDYFNKVWHDFTGRTLEQELGDGWAEGVHPDDLDMCFNTFTTAFDKRENFSMTYRMRRFDGEYRWILDEGKPRYNMQGEFIGYIGNCLDITEMKLAEEKL